MANRFIYKIKDTNTGLFSTGGMSPRWTKNGKVWNSIGSLKCHLRQFMATKKVKDTSGYYVTDWKVLYNKIPHNWEVIEIELVEKANIYISAHHLYPEELND